MSHHQPLKGWVRKTASSLKTALVSKKFLGDIDLQNETVSQNNKRKLKFKKGDIMQWLSTSIVIREMSVQYATMGLCLERLKMIKITISKCGP